MELKHKYICCKCWKVLDASPQIGASYKHNSFWTVPPLFIEEMCTDCMKKYHLEYYTSVLDFEKEQRRKQ